MRFDRPVLIADIGGTNARFALLRHAGDQPKTPRRLLCADYAGVVDAARAYLGAAGRPDLGGAVIAVAGPVTGDDFTLTNNGWRIDTREIRSALGIADLHVVNDFAAQAMAIPTLGDGDVRQLGPGIPKAGEPAAAIGPGTGLGVASLVRCGDEWRAIQGEGGHVTFSPVTDREMAVSAAVRERFGHCSAERLFSGPGLTVLYETLGSIDGTPADTSRQPAEIVARALRGGDARASEAIDLFVAGLATTAGNLALTLGAAGGVYLCGGVLPRLGAALDARAFRDRFEWKGRFSGYLASIPTFLVTTEEPALRGLAVLARQRLTAEQGARGG